MSPRARKKCFKSYVGGMQCNFFLSIKFDQIHEYVTSSREPLLYIMIWLIY
jgi:hypothetical protein